MSLNIKIDADISGVDQAVNNVSKSLNSLKAPAVNANNALFSVSQVARDLPFGFIAIQNNLPLVVDSFGQLTKQAGGVGNALKSLGASLIGPAGISFAFGAVVAGVTALIQKYGSLGEAANQILGLTPKVTEAQKAYNKAIYETTGNLTLEQEKINILVKSINDLSRPQKERIAAYEALKKIAPDVVAGIRDENALSRESISIINDQAEARKELLRLKIQEAGIAAAATTNATKLAQLNAELAVADQKSIEAAKELEKSKGKAGEVQLITGFGSTTQLDRSVGAFNKANDAVNDLKKQIKELEQENEGFLKQLDPTTNRIAQLTKKTNDRTEALKEQIKFEKSQLKGDNFKFEIEDNTELLSIQQKISLLEKLGTVVLNTKNSEKKRAEALKELGVLDERNFGNLKLSDFTYKQLEATLRKVGKSLQDLLVDQKNIASTKIPTLDLFPEQDKRFKEASKGLEEFRKNNVEVEVNKKPPSLLPGPAIIEEQKRIDDLLSRFANVKTVLEGTFFNPLSDLFENFFTTGKFAFADFGKVVMQTLKKIAAQIIATGIIKLLATILTAGATGGTGVAAISGAQGIGGFLKGVVGSVLGVNLGKVAAPSFGGVQGGSLAMGGQVNVVLRGTDLVGSINRTNANISRVG